MRPCTGVLEDVACSVYSKFTNESCIRIKTQASLDIISHEWYLKIFTSCYTYLVRIVCTSRTRCACSVVDSVLLLEIKHFSGSTKQFPSLSSSFSMKQTRDNRREQNLKKSLNISILLMLSLYPL